jgi:hypothetical protein
MEKRELKESGGKDTKNKESGKKREKRKERNGERRQIETNEEWN